MKPHEEDRRQPGQFQRETGRIRQACTKMKNSTAKLKSTPEGGDGDTETGARGTQNAPGIDQGRKIKSDASTDTVDTVET